MSSGQPVFVLYGRARHGCQEAGYVVNYPFALEEPRSAVKRARSAAITVVAEAARRKMYRFGHGGYLRSTLILS
jgi:hypothetical protein